LLVSEFASFWAILSRHLIGGMTVSWLGLTPAAEPPA